MRGIERPGRRRRHSDGAGVSLTRVLTQAAAPLDPFLMLDAFGSADPDDYIRRLPRPSASRLRDRDLHARGRMRHRDNAGHEGLPGDGGVQWMVAGAA